MKLVFITPIIALLLCAITACSTNPLNVKTDVVTDEFKDFATYSWHIQSKQGLNPAEKKVDSLVKAIVNKQLAAKGYALVAAAKADFLVNYELTAQDLVDVTAMNVYSGMGDGFVWRHGEGVSNEVYVQSKEYNIDTFKKGTLIFDFVNATSDKLVWRGVATKRIDHQLNNAEIEAGLNNAFNALLKDIPSAKK